MQTSRYNLKGGHVEDTKPRRRSKENARDASSSATGRLFCVMGGAYHGVEP